MSGLPDRASQIEGYTVVELQAYGRARRAVMLEGEAEVAAAWARLEADFGWRVAAAAWRRACEDTDREAGA